MHATLPAGKSAIDALAPRVKSERHADAFSEKSSKRHDDFASRLDQARDRSAREDTHEVKNDSKGAKPDAKAEGKPQAKQHDDAKPVDRAKSRDDARQNDGDEPKDKIATADAKKPTATKPDDAAAEDTGDADDETIVEVKKSQEQAAKSADAEAQAAWAAAMQAANAQQSSQQADAADKPAEDTDADSTDAAATLAAAAVATQATTTASDDLAADQDGQSSEGDTASTQAVTAANLTPAGAEEKATKPQQSAAKADGKNPANNSAAAASAADATAPRQHGAKHGEQEQPKQQQEAPAPTTAALPEAAAGAKEKKSAESTFDEMLAKLAPQDQTAPKPVIDRPAAPAPTLPPEKQFATDNVDNVVKSVRTQLDAGGGQMKMRLDPPELGALEVAVKMVDGKMTASFTTSNEQATQLLSHSLSDLKHSLEASGISVDRIQVRQSSTDHDAQQQPGEHKRDGQSGAFDQPSSRGDQQRKEAVEKMWRKLAYGSDELDFVA